MNEHDIAEQAYKNGYEQGKRDAVKHGRWITTAYKPFVYSKCSLCGHRVTIDGESNYCPNCGARMDGDGNA